MSFLFLALSAWLAAASASAQDETVTALITKLSDVDSEIRANAAAELRKLLTSDAGARTNNHGRLYWVDRLNQVKPGMTHDEAKRLLPPTHDNIMEAWSGGTGNRTWRLDDYWTVTVHYYYPDSVHEMRPSLHRRARAVAAQVPASFTGTWTTYHVNGQRSHEVNYKSGKYHGTLTAFHDNGRKLFEQHYVDGTCSGTDCGWYFDGAPSYEGDYVDGKQDGTWTHWSEDGRLQSRRELRAGEYDGVNTTWHENGQKRYESAYKAGKKHGHDKAWDADGKLLWSRTYENGELVE
jgi:antitoxin component YwqK of YwqJK toxin-antitoxin module